MRHDDAYLLDMLLAAREAGKFTDGLTLAEFKRNRMAQLAILKAVEVVGEATPRSAPKAKKHIPKSPGPRSSACGIVSCMDISTSIWRGCGKPCSRTFPFSSLCLNHLCRLRRHRGTGKRGRGLSNTAVTFCLASV